MSDSDYIKISGPIPKVDDFTAYLSEREALGQPFPKIANQVDCEAPLSSSLGVAGGRSPRIHACRCYKAKYWSLTIRQKAEAGQIERAAWGSAVPDNTAYTAKEYKPGIFLNSHREYCDILHNLIFDPEGIEPTGIVVVTGSTGTGKSQIIRGLLDLYLRDSKNHSRWEKAGRVPHLVTYEDPIEVPFFDGPSTDARTCWLDYTPRQRHLDVSSLQDAIRSALRQTPAAFYVGEVRDLREWKELLEFAGTGHLIFTTAHAGSLVEAMGKILAATEAHNSAKRAIVADRLLADFGILIWPSSAVCFGPPSSERVL